MKAVGFRAMNNIDCNGCPHDMQDENGTEYRRYVPELKCNIIPRKYAANFGNCSECGYLTERNRYNYCPNCGAKIVE